MVFKVEGDYTYIDTNINMKYIDAEKSLKITEINVSPPESQKFRPHFKSLTPIHPNKKITLEGKNHSITNRLIDMFAPIGFGQRGLIAAPPKVGKTTLLKDMANGIAHNHPDAELLILLIDERPEEVTDIKRSVKATVHSSTFDELPKNHIKTTELVLESAMQLKKARKRIPFTRFFLLLPRS